MELNAEVVLTCLVIVIARVADVSLGTLRMVSVINGRRWSSWALGFAEVLVWIVVVSEVIKTINQSPLYPLAYAFGFATGSFLGITIESRLAFGDQMVRLFTRTPGVAAMLRNEGFGVTEFDGRGRDGPIQMLFIQTPRRDVPKVLARAKALDAACYYLVDDVRLKSDESGSGMRGWGLGRWLLRMQRR